jgi:NADH:ubiquinone oxidoreductase subunit 6 (subunit J)
MPEMIPAIPFVLLAALTLFGASMVVLSDNVVHAAFWVLEVMMAVAGLYMLLSAGYLALVQIVVYAGAVSVLLLFTIMLTLRSREDAVRSLDLSWTAGALALAVLASVAMVVVSFRPVVQTPPLVTPGILDFGRLLFTRWALPFEIASVVLLIALVGAVWWAGSGEKR